MNEISWYKNVWKTLPYPTLPTAKYLEYFNIVKELEFRYAVTYNEGLSRQNNNGRLVQ